MSIFLFAAGVWALQWLPDLPAPVVLAGCALAALAAAAVTFRLRGGSVRSRQTARVVLAVAAVLAGFAWAGARAHWRLADALPMAWEGRDVVVEGVVAELPQTMSEGVRFAFTVERAEGPVPEQLLLSWYRGRDEASPMPQVAAGERWRLTVRLKRPHGFVNPEGFDYEAWLLERGVRATGYVRAAPEALRLAERQGGFMGAVHRLRAAVRDRFLATLGDAPYAGVLVALTVGDQHAITSAQWEVFRRTGIAHLVSISGMHISFVALLAGGMLAWLWRRVPALVLRLPARRAGAVAAMLAGVGYALLAGLGIPVQRAAIMLVVVAAALGSGREAAPARVLALALLGVLVVDPWGVLSAGFWLSFGAVGAILFLLGGRVVAPTGWRAAVRIQLGITLATLPLLLALFQSFSLASPLANALAIPLVSFVVTPLALLAMLLPFAPLLELAHWLTAWMMRWAEWLAASPLALWQQPAAPGWLLAAGVMAVVVLLLPRAAPGKTAAAAVLGALLAWPAPRPPDGGFRATVLDVGNGLAVHVQTASHDLLYDAGPPYGPKTDAGERVVLPYLAAQGVQRLHRLVLSHDDGDHVGGADSVLEGLPVEAVMAGEPGVLALAGERPGQTCAAGSEWEWDGVRFAVLHPVAGRPPARRNNDDSCVIRVEAAGGSLLLVGDIEQRAEAGLVARAAPLLASSVVVAAHHGSRSSSSPAFVDASLPEAVVFSVGYRNMFGHPHPAVWARWAEAGARSWRTDSQGAVEVRVDAAGVEVQALRQRAPRYWHGR